jgi:hypothetical protein
MRTRSLAPIGAKGSTIEIDETFISKTKAGLGPPLPTISRRS